MADISQIKLPNGDTFDIIDEKSGYITAQYIENKTDYAIPVSRVGEIVVGETPIGTDSTNFPTSKAVVDYVDERVVQEIEAIDVGVSSVNGKTGAITISASDVGAATQTDITYAINNKIHIVKLNYYNTIDGTYVYSSGDITNSDVRDYIDNNEMVLLTTGKTSYIVAGYDRGLSDLSFYCIENMYVHVLYPYKYNDTYTNLWYGTSNELLTFETLPIYDGTVE